MDPALMRHPQGSVVGLALFLVYINDLSEFARSEVFIFTGDTVIYTTTKDAAQLQDDLSNLKEWKAARGMQFNQNRCPHIKLSRNKIHTINKSYSFHNIIILKEKDI